MITLSANTGNSPEKTVTKRLTNLEAMKNIFMSTRVPSMYVTPVARDLSLKANLLLTSPSIQGYVCIIVPKENAARVLPMQVT